MDTSSKSSRFLGIISAQHSMTLKSTKLVIFDQLDQLLTNFTKLVNF
jgi:hypothetical protein